MTTELDLVSRRKKQSDGLKRHHAQLDLRRRHVDMARSRGDEIPSGRTSHQKRRYCTAFPPSPVDIIGESDAKSNRTHT